MLRAPTYLSLADPAHSEARLRLLEERCPGPRERGAEEAREYLDTFDWRLFRAGASLSARRRRDGVVLRLRRAGEAEVLEQTVPALPAFEWDLPKGPLRKALRRIVEMRRLTPLVRVRSHRETFPVLDDEQKTIARVTLERGTACRPRHVEQCALPPTLRIVALRGYERETAAFSAYVERELGFETKRLGTAGRALEAVGYRPGATSAKFRVQLDPAQRADTAMKRIYLELFTAMQANEEGMLADTDSEFLHDFRVAVRRTRSALAQVRGVFPSEDIEHFKQEFRWVGQVTGPTRDMDVYLLSFPGFRADLPAKERADLDPLHAYLVRHQRIEQHRLVAALRSPRFEQLRSEWAAFLDKPVPTGTDLVNAVRPVRTVASERIHAMYGKIVRHGSRITPGSRAQRLHDLRIECKKLRYLLTFFRGLYPADDVDGLVRVLRGLQDVLGLFNDYEVQQDKLHGFGEEMVAEGTAQAGTLLAMGRLIGDLARSQHAQRKAFHERFDRLASTAVRAQAARLFGPVEGGVPE